VEAQRTEYWSRHAAVISAAHLAGRMKLTDAAADLRELQRSEYWGLSSSGRGQEGPDGIDPLARQELTLRQHSQLALRRLGETPSPLPAITFRLPDGTVIPAGPLGRPREQVAAEVGIGMGVRAVLEAIGAPDVVAEERVPSGQARWEYDVDGSNPFTLVIIWRGGQVQSIDRRRPVAWQDGLARDESLCNPR
jgi:hypothetical protein